jgi:hypothetical protein
MDEHANSSECSTHESLCGSEGLPRSSAVELFEAFESDWNHGNGPEIPSFLSRYCGPEILNVAAELIQIDMERRWRSRSSIKRTELPNYLHELDLTFERVTMTTLIGWEFYVRNTWGDCIPRNAMLRRHPELSPDLAAAIDAASLQIAWPVIDVVRDGKVVLTASIDRPLRIGRQRDTDSSPWIIHTSDEYHHLVLGSANDPGISRNQLEITLSSLGTARFENTSTQRALAFSGGGVIAPGCCESMTIPAKIHLGNQLFLNLRPLARN